MQLSSVRSLCSSFAGGEWRQKWQHRCSRGAASDLHSTSRVVSLRGRKQSATDSHPTDLQFSAAAAKGAFPRVFAACCERAKRGIRRTKPAHVQPQEAQSRPLGPACTAQGAPPQWAWECTCRRHHGRTVPAENRVCCAESRSGARANAAPWFGFNLFFLFAIAGDARDLRIPRTRALMARPLQ